MHVLSNALAYVHRRAWLTRVTSRNKTRELMGYDMKCSDVPRIRKLLPSGTIRNVERLCLFFFCSSISDTHRLKHKIITFCRLSLWDIKRDCQTIWQIGAETNKPWVKGKGVNRRMEKCVCVMDFIISKDKAFALQAYGVQSVLGG
jgi:hypothetical protein